MDHPAGRPGAVFGDHPDGAYLSLSPVGEVDHDEDHTVTGRTIRFMWDYCVSVPLWDEDGLLPEEEPWLRRALGLSSALIADLAAWGGAMGRLIDHRTTAPGEAEALEGLDARARELVERLESEIGGRYEVVYRPWC